MKRSLMSIGFGLALVWTGAAEIVLGPPWDQHWGIPGWPGPGPGPYIFSDPPWLPPGSDSLAIHVSSGDLYSLKWEGNVLDLVGEPGATLSFDLTMIAGEWNGELTRIAGIVFNNDAGWQQLNTPLSIVDKTTGLPTTEVWTSLDGDVHKTFTYDISSVTVSGGWMQIYFGLQNLEDGPGNFYFDRVWLVPEPSSAALLGLGLGALARLRRPRPSS